MRPYSPDVLMLGWELPPYNTGGLGVACYGLAKGLSSKGVNISFGLPRQLPTKVPFMRVMDHPLAGVQVTAINSLLKSYMSNSHYQQSHQCQTDNNQYSSCIYTESQRFAHIAHDWSQQTPHQLVHGHDWMSYPAGMRASKASGQPFIAHIHATEYDRTGGHLDDRIAQVEYQGLNSADHVIAVSEYTKKTVHQKYGVKTKNISVVHNGVDFNYFQPSKIRNIFPHHNIVLYVGRLTYQKGVEYFLKAAKQVAAEHPDTIFVVVGDGDMYQRHVLEAASLGIGDKVIFTGFLQGDKLKSTYQMADAFVMPSVSEPYGIVALEAIASGTPAIISNQSGVSETLEHIFKVDFWDTQKMADYISTVLTFPMHSRELTRLAQAEAKKLTWDSAAQKTLNIYQQFL